MNFTVRIIGVPAAQIFFPGRAVIQAAQQKPGIFIAVRNACQVNSSAFAVGMSRKMDFVAGVFDNLGFFGKSIDIVPYFSPKEKSSFLSLT